MKEPTPVESESDDEDLIPASAVLVKDQKFGETEKGMGDTLAGT